MLYDKEFIDSLPEPEEEWKSPLVVYVAKEVTEKHKHVKEYLVDWYEKLPISRKNNCFARLRSLDDKEFISQINEFYVADFCGQYGVVETEPTLENGKTPDMLWTIGNEVALLDVVTIFEQPDIGAQSDGIDLLLNYLSDIEHYYDLCISYEDINTNTLKPSAIKRRLLNYLDEVESQEERQLDELFIDENGFTGTFIPTRREEKRRISFALLGEARTVDPLKAIENRIRSKIRKYKDWDGPIFVAVCKAADFGADWDDVATVLFGESVTTVNFSTSTVSEELSGGIIMSHGGRPPRNTSLSGVLHIEQNWNNSPPNIEVLYLKNPNATYQLDLPIPSYPTITDSKVHFEWQNDGGRNLGQHW